MKKILTSLMAVMFVLLAVSSTTFAAAATDEQAVTASFKEVIQKHIDSYQDDPRIMVYAVPDPLWIKSKCTTLNNYTYYIQKTNSIITPYIGTLIYDVQIWLTDYKPNKDAAESCEIYRDKPYTDNFRITFSYQNNQWAVKKYEYKSPYSDKWFDITDGSDPAPYNRMLVKE